jgi:signal transduction histidine kinase
LIKTHSASEALEHLLRNDIAVVLLDVTIRGRKGFPLANLIRKHPRFQDVAMIFLSAAPLRDSDRIKLYEGGASDYISGPIAPELLRAKVRVFADLYRKKRQLEVLNHQLRRLSASMITSQDQERRRIARELHDSLGQELSVAKMTADGIRQLPPDSKDEAAAHVSGMIDHVLQQVRSISHLLHPPLLDEAGLVSALTSYVEGFTKRSGIDTTIDIQPPDLARLNLDLETTLFRIVQEALTNILRHSQAHKASVSLAMANGQISLKILDDGKGIGQAMNPSFNTVGVGLGGMRQRAREFGGELRVSNGAPGTVIEVTIPIESCRRELAVATA